MNKDQQFEALKDEVVRLFEYVQKIKREIASIKHPRSEIDHFNTVADQLDDIVKSTEKATQTIMDSAESISDSAGQLHSGAGGAEADGAFNSINDDINQIFEACSFHDLTGQRISKIIRTMNMIEGSLNSLVVIVGEDGIAALPITKNDPEEESHDDGVPLHGPQSEGKGISQDEIDKLFD